jgi:hypothetical protein
MMCGVGDGVATALRRPGADLAAALFVRRADEPMMGRC